jgi:hypothetical protein
MFAEGRRLRRIRRNDGVERSDLFWTLFVGSSLQIGDANIAARITRFQSA